MENGFQRIGKKLDIIISQNEEIIFTDRQIEANTSKIVERTTEMLNKLQRSLELQQRTEQNALEAAQYASICATYSKVNAFSAQQTISAKEMYGDFIENDGLNINVDNSYQINEMISAFYVIKF